MATRVVYSDANVTVTEVTSDSPLPDQPGGWRGLQYAWAAGTVPANLALLRQRAQAALVANATFLAVPVPASAPTLGQVQTLWNQVQALTKEDSALIRLALGLFDDTSGT